MERRLTKRSGTSVDQRKLQTEHKSYLVIYKNRPKSINNSDSNMLAQENSYLKNRIKSLEDIITNHNHSQSEILIENAFNLSQKNVFSHKFQKNIIVNSPINEKKGYTSRLKESISIMSKEIKELKQENFLLKQEIAKNAQNNKSNLMVWRIYQACTIHSIDIDELWYIINPNEKHMINSQDFIRGIKAIDVDISEKWGNKLFNTLTEGEKEVSKDIFFINLKTLKPILAVTKNQLLKPLEYLSIAIGSHNINMASLSEMILKKSFYSYKKFFEFFKQNFSGIGEKYLELICQSIFAEKISLNSQDICKLLNKLIPSYKIFDSDQEKKIKKSWKKIINEKGEEFLKFCEKIDKEYIGNISWNDFISIIKRLNFEIDGDLELYLKYICYCKCESIELVPYGYLYTF